VNEVVQGALLTFGLLTPFMLTTLAWARTLSKGQADLKLSVTEKSARQDTTLEDHERRITNLEHPNR
jgi:hypothetical protein